MTRRLVTALGLNIIYHIVFKRFSLFCVDFTRTLTVLLGKVVLPYTPGTDRETFKSGVGKEHILVRLCVCQVCSSYKKYSFSLVDIA